MSVPHSLGSDSKIIKCSKAYSLTSCQKEKRDLTSWFGIVVDEMHEVPIQTRRFRRKKTSQIWKEKKRKKIKSNRNRLN